MPPAQSGDHDESVLVDRLNELFQGILPPMACRILAALLITDEPHLSSRDLAEHLSASSSSISTMARLLNSLGLVDRDVSVETRRDLFSVDSEAWPRTQLNGQEELRGLLLALNDAVMSREPHSASAVKLRSMRDFYTFMYDDAPHVLARYAQWLEADSVKKAWPEDAARLEG
ncbi:MarR family transcriptional regulator [Rhizohabitans arisaemae]|uniref:MarR family transcriptional regulator n=1 Tax=Rhizohabitans arisaemae TaxID=2720610 RepID=UPI0024B04AFF|nr:MarR family transcriptional regulator [Rhizohabitans arisaemae]